MAKWRKKKRSGQSTVEFVFTFMIFLGFVLFFFQLSMMIAYGNFVHYATFMAARAYLSAGTDKEDQKRRAQDSLTSLVRKLRTIGIPVGGGTPPGAQIGEIDRFRPDEKQYSWMEGVRYSFKSKLFLIPFAGAGKSGTDDNSLTLISESFLGRDPSAEECRRFQLRNGSSLSYDNGC